MGTRGPVPKRSDQRIRRNAAEPVTTLKPIEGGSVKQPELNLAGWEEVHPRILSFWKALGESAQAQYYQPSDWEYAAFTLHFVNGLLLSRRPSSQMLAAVDGMLSKLLVSEGDRRRARIEIENPGFGAGDKPAGVSDAYKDLLRGKRAG